MLMNTIDAQEVFPQWSANSGLDLWRPDDLYIQWLTFLYSIWQKVDYL